MLSEPTSPDWAQIRYDYEYTDRPIEDICAAHGISSGTLRDRMRRWDWTRRRPPIPRDGPPPTAPVKVDVTAPPPSVWQEPDLPAPAIETAQPPWQPVRQWEPSPHLEPAVQAAAGRNTGAPDDRATRLQSAVARVLPAIEATVAKLGAGPLLPREMEQTARALASLTRTLRELNGLLGQQQGVAGGRICDCDMPENIDDFRNELARQIDGIIAERKAEPQGS